MEVAAKNVQMHIVVEIALKKAGETTAKSVQLSSEVKHAIQGQVQEVNGVTDAEIATIVQEVMQELSTLMSQSQGKVVQRQNVELQELSQTKMQCA